MLYKQKGSEVWHMDVSHQGRRIRKSTGTTNKKQAEKMYCSVRNQLMEGTFMEHTKGKDKTFEQMIDRYLDEVTPDKKPSTQRDDKYYAKLHKKAFGTCRLNEVTSDKISRYLLKRKKKVGSCSINRELSFMSAAFNQAIKVWDWCRDNPVSRIKREKEKKRVKYFSEKEFSKIYEKLVDWVKPIVMLAKNTGLRKSNLVNLKWTEVDLKQSFILLDSEVMKNSEHLGVPLNSQALEVLKGQKRVRKLHSPYVFCKKDGNSYSTWGVYRAFKKACIAVKLGDFRFHDLRHDFCSKLVQAGVDLYTVKELAGHKDITTTQRYAHLNQSKLRKAVEVLECHNPVIVHQKGATQKV